MIVISMLGRQRKADPGSSPTSLPILASKWTEENEKLRLNKQGRCPLRTAAKV